MAVAERHLRFASSAGAVALRLAKAAAMVSGRVFASHVKSQTTNNGLAAIQLIVEGDGCHFIDLGGGFDAGRLLPLRPARCCSRVGSHDRALGVGGGCIALTRPLASPAFWVTLTVLPPVMAWPCPLRSWCRLTLPGSGLRHHVALGRYRRRQHDGVDIKKRPHRPP